MCKTAKHQGVTLVESLMAIILVAILVAIISFSYRYMIYKSEEVTCVANRKTIHKAYDFYSMDLSNPVSLEEFLQNKDKLATAWLSSNINCPSDGIYSVVDNSIVCSVHDKSVEPDYPPGTIIPGTDGHPGTEPVEVDGDWGASVVPMPGGGPNQYDLHTQQGTVFYNEDTGKYYVVVAPNGNMPIYLETPNLDPTDPGWPGWLSSTGTGIVEINEGRNTDLDDLDLSTHKFRRGDVTFKDGAYYVCMIQGGTETTLNQWNVPPGADWYWYKLGN